MKHLRWLASCIFVLVLAACSSPEDLQAGVETQFGDSDDNIGIDVTSPFAGRVYILSHDFYTYFDEGLESSVNWVILDRYDGAGTLIWKKYLLVSDYCDGCNATPLGVFSDKNGYAYSIFRSYEDGYMAYRTDSQGNVVGRISLNESINDENSYEYAGTRKFAVDSTGNLYYAREVERYDYAINKLTYINRLSKYNSNGVLQWTKTLSTGIPSGLAVSGSNVYIAGSTSYAKYTSTGTQTWLKSGAGNDITVAGSYFYIRRGSTVLKYDSNGKQLWSKAQSGLSSPVYGEMTGDSAGNIYLSGKINVSGKARDGFVRKLNASGTVVWTKTNVASTTAYDDVRGITSVNGSEILITGETQGALAHSNRGGDNNRDGYVRELNSSGNSVWIK